MIRIPNPISDPKIFMRIFRDIYRILRKFDEFEIDDISRAMIATNNVTSQGAIGEEALRRSTRAQRSLDGIYNQSKSYAELFRTLGWIQSTSTKKLKTCAFSLLGQHIARAHNPDALMSECLLGIAYPNEVLSVKGNQTIRVIGSILLVMDALGSITRDEMMAGPMSLDDDTNPNTFNDMVQRLTKCRTKPHLLDDWLNKIAARRHIKRGSTMTNYTRFPIGVLRGSGWSDDKRGGPLTISSEGHIMASRLRQAPDMRLSHFNGLPDEVKPAYILWTFYAMLKRTGFNVEPVHDVMNASAKKLSLHGLPHSGDVFFSPFQQLSRETITKWTPELVPTINTIGSQSTESLVTAMANRSGPIVRERNTLIFDLTDRAAVVTSGTDAIINEIKAKLRSTRSVDATADALVASYRDTNRNVFYPLVVSLFCVIGFKCRLSRGGQNYERADAIILDKTRSIPIEIKSPGEETEISVKGVRQALENKVVLLSRRSYPTDAESTSLVVGFNLPNERSEVHELVDDIRKAFNIRIGIIDFRSLALLATHTVQSGKQLYLSDVHKLQGAIRVQRLATKH